MCPFMTTQLMYLSTSIFPGILTGKVILSSKSLLMYKLSVILCHCIYINSRLDSFSLPQNQTGKPSQGAEIDCHVITYNTHWSLKILEAITRGIEQIAMSSTTIHRILKACITNFVV